MGVTLVRTACRTGGSPLEKIGRREENVVEPTELRIGRVYEDQWKKMRPI